MTSAKATLRHLLLLTLCILPEGPLSQESTAQTQVKCIPTTATQYKGLGDSIGFKVDKKGNVFALMRGDFDDCGASWIPYGALNKRQALHSGIEGYWKLGWNEMCFYGFNKVDKVENGHDYVSPSSTERRMACVEKR